MESKVLFRTFIAIPLELPEELRHTLVLLKKEFETEKIRWVDPGQMHLTLKFLGETTQDQVHAVSSRIRDTYSNYKRATIQLRGLGTFSHRSELKVLWTGIENERILKELHETTRRMLNGILPLDDTRKFRPHLTLARMKHNIDRKSFKDALQRYNDRDFGTCDLEKVVFFRSILQPSGAVQKVLDSFTFR